MSLHFLLDGYNIIKQTPSLNHGTLEGQRLALIQWIKIHQPQGSLRNMTTIVFDGKSEFFGALKDSEVKVIFSQDRPADDVIKHLVQQNPKKRWVVVSDDKDIRLYVRALGAAILGVREYLAKSQETKIKQEKQAAGIDKHASKYISLTAQAIINQELEKIWIKPKK